MMRHQVQQRIEHFRRQRRRLAVLQELPPARFNSEIAERIDACPSTAHRCASKPSGNFTKIHPILMTIAPPGKDHLLEGLKP